MLVLRCLFWHSWPLETRCEKIAISQKLRIWTWNSLSEDCNFIETPDFFKQVCWGCFGLQTASEAKSDLRFEIWSQNLTIHHVCYGLKLVDRRLQFHRNSGFFQANSLRLFWPQNGLGGQIRPHHWFSLGQFALPTKFQVSRASPWPFLISLGEENCNM